MDNALKHWYDLHHRVTGTFNGNSGAQQNNYSLDGIASVSVGAFVGIVAWYFGSGLLLHNFGDSGWRKSVSNILPLPLALAAGIFATHLTADISDKGMTRDVWGQAVMETVKTVSDYTGLGQPTMKRAAVPLPPPPTAPRILPMQR
jgi:hypothetical protein